MARGQVEAINKGYAEPMPLREGEREIRVTDQIRIHFAPIAEKLRTKFRSQSWTRVQFEMAIEREFRDWLIDNICIPLGLYQGGCVQLAYEIAKEE